MDGSKSILWIHGWGTSVDWWEDLVVQLTEYEHHFFEYPDSQSIEDIRSEMSLRIAQFNEPVTVVGWSLGGVLTLDYLLSTPDENINIHRVLLIGATLCFISRNRLLGWPEPVLRRMQQQLSAGQGAVTLRKFRELVSAPHPTWEQSLPMLTYSDFPFNALITGLEYLCRTDLRESWCKQAESLSKRIYWIHGELDEVCPIGAVPFSDLKERLFIVPGTGHCPFLPDGNFFTEMIRVMIEGNTDDA